jgi:hypothetical protein
MKKAIVLGLSLAVFIFSVPIYFGVQTVRDEATVAQVKQAYAYIESYYNAHNQYPSLEDMQQQFLLSSGDPYPGSISYTFRADFPRTFSLSYALNDARSFAVGVAVEDAKQPLQQYSLDSCANDARCQADEYQEYPAGPIMYLAYYADEYSPPTVQPSPGSEVALMYSSQDGAYLSFWTDDQYYQDANGQVKFKDVTKYDPAYFTETATADSQNPATLVPGATPQTFHYLDLMPTGKLGTTSVTYTVDCSQVSQRCDPTITLPVEIFAGTATQTQTPTQTQAETQIQSQTSGSASNASEQTSPTSTVTYPQLIIDSPNGGASIGAGEPIHIAWHSINPLPGANVNLSYSSCDHGCMETPIASILPSMGSYDQLTLPVGSWYLSIELLPAINGFTPGAASLITVVSQ